ncbi:MAG: glycosyl transferase family 2 [Bacteroidetes bacterium B1(2017)]|nr:MAG: glycosyl transferase family 2 [Bacteroidetes bacterium B1(2017)]
MIKNKKIIVVLPAYNAENTLIATLNEIPFDIVDDIILVDDCSSDKTIEIAKSFGLKHVYQHDSNLGYGANQKSCYKKAIELNADIVIMLHPDYQYTPKLIESFAYIIVNDVYPVVLGSRILGKGALKGGMPIYKYFFNRLLTLAQNIIINQKLSEYHSGYRAFSTNVLKKINFEVNSNDFVFDNQILSQIFMEGYEIGEISCPTRYFKDASSINFKRSLKYGIGCLLVSIEYRMHKWKIYRSHRFMS